MEVETLSTCLWEERHALEELAFRLETELALVAAGRHRWLARSTAAIEQALATLNEAEVRRSAAVVAITSEIGLPSNTTLNQLAEAFPDQATALHSHRRHLRELLHQVDTLTEQNQNLLARNLAATTDALALLGIAPTYGPDSGAGRSHHHDQTSTSWDSRAVLVSTRA